MNVDQEQMSILNNYMRIMTGGTDELLELDIIKADIERKQAQTTRQQIKDINRVLRQNLVEFLLWFDRQPGTMEGDRGKISQLREKLHDDRVSLIELYGLWDSIVNSESFYLIKAEEFKNQYEAITKLDDDMNRYPYLFNFKQSYEAFLYAIQKKTGMSEALLKLEKMRDLVHHDIIPALDRNKDDVAMQNIRNSFISPLIAHYIGKHVGIQTPTAHLPQPTHPRPDFPTLKVSDLSSNIIENARKLFDFLKGENVYQRLDDLDKVGIIPHDDSAEPIRALATIVRNIDKVYQVFNSQLILMLVGLLSDVTLFDDMYSNMFLGMNPTTFHNKKEFVSLFFLEVGAFPNIISKLNLKSRIERDTHIYRSHISPQDILNSERVLVVTMLRELVKTNIQYFIANAVVTLEFGKLLLLCLEKIQELKRHAGTLMDQRTNLKAYYDNLIQKYKRVYGFIKYRQDTATVNPRYKLKVVDNYLFMKYFNIDKAYEVQRDPETKQILNHTTRLNDLKKDASAEYYFFGPYDGVFDRNMDNKKVAESISDKVFNVVIKRGEDCVIVGYGQSGSGKTSSLVFLKTPGEEKKGIDGILIELCNSKSFRSTFQRIELEMTNIYMFHGTRASSPNTFEDSFYKESTIVIEDPPQKDADENLLRPRFVQYGDSWVYEPDLGIDEKRGLGYFILTAFEKREVEPTPNNPNSSRSHVVVCLYLFRSDGAVQKMVICDLAGVENVFACKDPREIIRFDTRYQVSDKYSIDRDTNFVLDSDRHFCDQDTKGSSVTIDDMTQIDKYNDNIRRKSQRFLEELPLITNNATNSLTSIKPEVIPVLREKMQGVIFPNIPPLRKPEKPATPGRKPATTASKPPTSPKGKPTQKGGSSCIDRGLVTSKCPKKLKFIHIYSTFETNEEILDYMNSYITKCKDMINLQMRRLSFPQHVFDFLFLDSLDDDRYKNVLRYKKEEFHGNTKWDEWENTFVKEYMHPYLKAYFKDDYNALIHAIRTKRIPPMPQELQPLRTNARKFVRDMFASEDVINSLFSTSDPVMAFIIECEPDISLFTTDPVTNNVQINRDIYHMISDLRDTEGTPYYPEFSILSWKWEEGGITRYQAEEIKLLLLLRLLDHWFCEEHRYTSLMFNCTLRVSEGFMINRFLRDFAKSVEDLIKQSLAIPGTKFLPVFLEKEIFPYCINTSIEDDKYDYFYGEASPSKDLAGCLMKILEKYQVRMQTVTFFVFTVINLTDNGRVNNPPNPPYINVNKLYTSLHYRRDPEKVKLEFQSLVNKLKTFDFYNKSSSPELKDIFEVESTISSQDDTSIRSNAEKLISFIGQNNPATLIGSLESTDKLMNTVFKKIPCSYNENLNDMLQRMEWAGLDAAFYDSMDLNRPVAITDVIDEL